jgi:uncharacterized membrane protein YidH (DUF202 family)
MNMRRLIGLVILIVGIVLLLFGINSTQTMGEHIVEGTTGRYTQMTMWYIIGGIILIIGGLGLCIKRVR